MCLCVCVFMCLCVCVFRDCVFSTSFLFLLLFVPFNVLCISCIFIYIFNSPTAIALRSSAIVKVSGQNCIRTFYGSLGQIRLGLPKHSCGQLRLGLPKGSVEGSTKVHKGCASFMTSLISLLIWGKSLSFPKGFCGGFPIASSHLSLSSFNSFCAFFPNSVSFRAFPHSKGLGAK